MTTFAKEKQLLKFEIISQNTCKRQNYEMWQSLKTSFEIQSLAIQYSLKGQLEG